MEHYLMLRIAHAAAAGILALGLVIHGAALMYALWRCPGGVEKTVRLARRFSLPLLALLGVSLPVTGWWLTHWAEIPLGQFWLLTSILLLPLFVPFGLLLAGNLKRWQLHLASKQAVGVKQKVFALLWWLALLALVVAINALMGIKPL
ncbi:MAG: DUF2269 family protein [Thiopseudomonas sp.]|nr:DUF2269 family protein [Thiopseudomonas sp.]